MADLKVAAFVSAMNDYFTQDNEATDDLAGDIQNLNDQIAALQATQGILNAEDQALLDGIQTTAGTALEKVKALAATTPPKTPPVV